MRDSCHLHAVQPQAYLCITALHGALCTFGLSMLCMQCCPTTCPSPTCMRERALLHARCLLQVPLQLLCKGTREQPLRTERTLCNIPRWCVLWRRHACAPCCCMGAMHPIRSQTAAFQSSMCLCQLCAVFYDFRPLHCNLHTFQVSCSSTSQWSPTRGPSTRHCHATKSWLTLSSRSTSRQVLLLLIQLWFKSMYGISCSARKNRRDLKGYPMHGCQAAVSTSCKQQHVNCGLKCSQITRSGPVPECAGGGAPEWCEALLCCALGHV